MIEVEIAPGKIVEFPEGTSQEEIARQLAPFLKSATPAGNGELPNISPGDIGTTIPTRPLEPGLPVKAFSAAAPQIPRAPIAGLPINTIQGEARKPTATEQMIGTRGSYVAGGGTIGALAGSALGLGGGPGGAVRGSVIGGGLGAAAGSALFDNINSFVKSINSEGAKINFGNPLQIAQRATNEGLTDVVFSLGFIGTGRVGKMLLGSVLNNGRSMMGRLLGVADSEVASRVAKADNFNIPIAAVDVSPAARATAAVLGVFPFIGGPVRKFSAQRAKQIIPATTDILNEVAPVTLMGDFGIDLLRAARKTHANTRGIASGLYEQFRYLARNADDPLLFSTKTIKTAISDIADEVSRGLSAAGGEAAGFKPSGKLIKMLQKWSALDDRLNIEQVRGLKRELWSLYKKTKDKETKKFIKDLGRAIEVTIQNPDVSRLPPEQAKRIIDSLEAANAFFSREMPKFETSTAKKFALVQKGVFGDITGFSKPGTRTADTLSKVFRYPTAQQVQEMAALAPPKTMKQWARTQLQNAYTEAIKNGPFDPDVFAAYLGVGSGDRLKEEGLSALLAKSDVPLSLMKDFIEVAKDATEFQASRVSTFLARRVTLAGGAGLVGGVFAGSQLAGGGTDTSLIVTGLIILAGRRAAKIITDPRKLRMMTTLLDRSKPISVRRELAKRLTRQGFLDKPINFVGGE